MNKLHYLLLTFSLIFLHSTVSFSQSKKELKERIKYLEAQLKQAQPIPGKCYARCVIPDESKPQVDSIIVFVYNGNETKVEGIRDTTIIVEQGTIKWMKKMADRSCLSGADCDVWCLVVVPDRVRTVKMVIDTIAVKEFSIETFKNFTFRSTHEYTEWREVICDNPINRNLVSQVQEALIREGFYKGKVDNVLDRELKEAISIYQKFKGLPIGELDLKTLESLGLK